MSWLKDELSKLDGWWFGSRSPASLGVLRILLGSLVVFALGMGLLIFSDFYGPKGYTPNPYIERFLQYQSGTFFYGTGLEFKLPFGVPRLTLLGGDPSYGWTLAVYLATIALAALFAVGLWTRWTGLALVLFLISVHTRNVLIIHSGDTLLRLCIIYLAFSQSGAMYSVDAWLKKRAALRAGLDPPDPSNLKVRVTGQRLIEFQVAVVYLCTVWWKLYGVFWLDGTATWYPTQLHEFRRFPYPDVFMRQPFLAMETYGTLLTEVALGTLVFWKPTRKWALLCGILMHSYIEYSFNIPLFALVIVSTYVAFYDGEEVQVWIEKVRAKLQRRAPLPEIGNLTADAGE